MPNHVDQDLWVTGPVVTLNEFKEFAHEGSGDMEYILSANKFIPYPKLYKDKDELSEEARKNGSYIPDGFNSGGYEWCCHHWGTKWGIYSANLTIPKSFGKSKKSKLFYTFQSAWSPAKIIVHAMSKQFPTLNFKLKYYEMGCQFKGTYIVEAGNVLEETQSKYTGRRGG
jgi:hypothetical protein